MNAIVVSDKHPELRRELLALVQEGRLSPATVVEAARPADSPLHEFFEWDDSVAAEGFRLIQAAGLIRRVKVDVIVGDREPTRIQVRAFVSAPSLRGGEQGSYVPIETAPLEELKREAIAQLDSVRRKYAHLEDLESIWAAIAVAKEGA